MVLIIKLMNSQNFSVNSHLLKFVLLCNDLRNNLLLIFERLLLQ